MYCAGVLTVDGGFMDSSSSRTKCITERLKTNQRQGLDHDPSRQSALAQAVDAGGKAIAMIGYDRHNGLTVHARTLKEHADEDWAADYLGMLADNFRPSILKTGSGLEIEED